MYNQNLKARISHDWTDESIEAKVRWFRSLTLEERMDYLVMITDLILEINPEVVKAKNDKVPNSKGRVQVVERPSGP